MIRNLIIIFVILQPWIVLGQQQKRYCSGFVKETTISTVAPVYNQEVWLTHLRNDRQPYFTDNVGKFYFYAIPATGDRLELPPNKIYRLLDSACLSFGWTDNPDFLTDIYIKRNERIQSDRANFNYTNDMRSYRVKAKVNNIRHQATISLRDAQQRTDRKREAYFSYYERLNLFSDVYATSIFPIVDANYARAFEQFQQSEDIAGVNTLNDNLLGSPLPPLPSLNKLRATAHIMKGVLLDTGYTDNPGVYYTKALYVDTQAFTISSYANYLFDVNRFAESISFLKLKLVLNNNLENFSARIYTLGQLIRAYDSLHFATDSGLIYAELIERYTKEIINGKVQQEHSSWIVGHEKIIQAKMASVRSFPIRRNKRAYIRSLSGLEKYFTNQFKTNTDSTLFWRADQSEQIFKIAVAYDSLLHRKKMACKYYERAIRIAYQQALVSNDIRNFELLKERYHAYLIGSSFRNRKLKFISKQLMVIEAETAMPVRFKVELQNEIKSLSVYIR
jgi:hypothetical protein